MPYPIKHFLTTLLIGPFFLPFCNFPDFIKSFSDSNVSQTLTGMIEMYPLFLVFGLVCALPVFLLYYLSYNVFVKTPLPDMVIKLILNIEAITGLFITLKLIGGTAMPTVIGAYSIAVIISSLFFKLKPSQSIQNPEPE